MKTAWFLNRSCLQLANAEGLATVAFPAISCGVYAFPYPRAAKARAPHPPAYVVRMCALLLAHTPPLAHTPMLCACVPLDRATEALQRTAACRAVTRVQAGHRICSLHRRTD